MGGYDENIIKPTTKPEGPNYTVKANETKKVM